MINNSAAYLIYITTALKIVFMTANFELFRGLEETPILI